jgi:ribosomal protein S18 acetylase RimI-like enzyme
MLLVPADKQEYHEFIRQLRNDPRVVDGFIQSSYITIEQQKEYMKKYSHCFFVCLIDEEPAGYIGVIDEDIRVATHPDYQKRGVGKFMLEQIKNKFPNALAKIKITNEASLKLFESSGFKIKYYLLERE